MFWKWARLRPNGRDRRLHLSSSKMPKDCPKMPISRPVAPTSMLDIGQTDLWAPHHLGNPSKKAKRHSWGAPLNGKRERGRTCKPSLPLRVLASRPRIFQFTRYRNSPKADWWCMQGLTGLESDRDPTAGRDRRCRTH